MNKTLNRTHGIAEAEAHKRLVSFLMSFFLGFALAFLLTLAGPSRAMAGDVAASELAPAASPDSSASSDSSASQNVSQSALVSGKVTETADSIIVDGATFVASDGKPVIKVDGDTKKRVILRNVKIISNNQAVSDVDDKVKGTAGVIAIDNRDSKSKVTLKNVKVVARNANVSSVSEEKDSCAGLVCNRTGDYDKYQSVSATSLGHTTISATQGSRPDYRKTQPATRYGTQRATVSAAATSNASGATMHSATQGTRPDYRKIPK